MKDVMLRGWTFHLKVTLDRQSQTAVYHQIAQALISEIQRGRLPSGSHLPGTRQLARALQVNRKTIINAYDELVAQGWLETSKAKGTLVACDLSSSIDVQKGRPPATRSYDLEWDRSLYSFAAREAHVIDRRRGSIALDDGVPDTRLFPAESFARAYRSKLTEDGRRGRLTYGDPRGSLRLREAISSMLNVERGLATTSDNICLTRGSQMAIYVTARMLTKRGDAIIVEQLTYPPAREAFRLAGAEILQVRLDEHGPDMDHLEHLCRYHRVRAIYLTPLHQFPTTLSLRQDRRSRLLALATRFGFAIVEDDYDHEFHFERQTLLPLASVDPGNVLYIGSMSKLLAPSLRIGYLVAPETVVERAAKEILLLDRQGDHVIELAAAELINTGVVRRHARKALNIYAKRRLHLAAMLAEDFDDVIQFRVPDGGLAFWLEFPDTGRLDALESRKYEQGLQFLPSRSFSGTKDGPRGIRMGFASLNESEMREALVRVRLALDAGPLYGRQKG
jgi:GntR family transcriptional regulator / MocR family aminotransferase